MSNTHHSHESDLLSQQLAALDTLSFGERAELVQALLSDPQNAQLAKLSLRMNQPAQLAATAIVQAAHAQQTSGFWRPALLTGCAFAASFVLFTSFNSRTSEVTGSPVLVQQSDRFGPAASFEGDVVTDRFGSASFEAN
jgi:hypothetical protein